MEIGNRIAFVIIWVGVITITGTLCFTEGEKKYQKLDHSDITIRHFRSAMERYKSLYYDAKKENEFFKEKIRKEIYETNNPH